jgi:hypothetical protein
VDEGKTAESVPTGKARGTHFVILRSLDSFHSLGIVVSEAEPRLGFASLRTTLSKGPRPKAVARVEGSVTNKLEHRLLADALQDFLEHRSGNAEQFGLLDEITEVGLGSRVRRS